MTITRDIQYIGVNDHNIDLFEGIYQVPNGMAYNSYVILDQKIAIMDTVDEGYFEQWFMQMKKILGNKKPDYLIVQHMEPDHSANIMNLMQEYPETILVASNKAFTMMEHFFGTNFTKNRMVVSDGDVLSLGTHKLIFVAAAMVHWPEVMVTYDATDKVLFSADAFGKFGALDVEDDWLCEARRYYFGIIGKYGVQVQNLLKKLAVWEIQKICPLHGPVLTENISYYTDFYHTWSMYQPEEEGILIAYTSIYGNTKKAALLLAEKLKERGCQKVIVKDLIRCDKSEAVEDAFRYSKMVLATTTYNNEIFPTMREFIDYLVERNFSNRVVALMENGSWASVAAKAMKEKLEKCKGLKFANTTVKITSALNDESKTQIEVLAEELV